MPKKETLVIALGGNALIKKGQKGTVYEQFANTREALEDIFQVIKQGHNLVITHGNGPQVGAIVIRSEMTKGNTYYIPLGVAVAESQGEIGYMIEQSLQNKLHLEGIKREVVTLLTQVLCDKNDPSIKKPSKPIGPFYPKEKIKEFEKNGVKYAKDAAGRGFRRVVPSPVPLKIVEGKTIKGLIEKGTIVIACGGGGMPVFLEPDGRLEGIDGVVDKDLASSVLAGELKAERLIILTEVEKVSLHFNTPNQEDLDKVSVKEAKAYLKAGHFPPGSMGPKVKACVEFLEKGGQEAIVTSIKTLPQALKGETGTHFVKK
jgi:carbamate kinase